MADKELVEYFPRKSGIKKFADAGLKVHKQCCGGEQPMYMGFSRFSPRFKETANPSYDVSRKTSPSNFPTTASKDSIAYRLGEALAAMKKENITSEIYKRWFFTN